MDQSALYSVAADAILILHVGFIAFIIVGLLLVFAGYFLAWNWVRNPWFRTAHLLGIAVVVVQSWFGIICPLTTWEMALRAKAGQDAYAGSFIAHWLGELIYYQAAPWVFATAYTLFGVLVILSWLLVRPYRLR
ncbi:MAG: DUF2784 domain-containing protein [Pseudomonadota bacterium]